MINTDIRETIRVLGWIWKIAMVWLAHMAINAASFRSKEGKEPFQEQKQSLQQSPLRLIVMVGKDQSKDTVLLEEKYISHFYFIPFGKNFILASSKVLIKEEKIMNTLNSDHANVTEKRCIHLFYSKSICWAKPQKHIEYMHVK